MNGYAEVLIGAVSVGCVAMACADPTHDEAVAALGGEAAGVAPGPLHRSGQPCTTCHGELGPASSEFSLGGTVYALLRQDNPAQGAIVSIEDITGEVFSVVTNPAGNFYVERDAWEPTYPIKAKVTFGPLTRQMLTHVGRAGSCADCHKGLPSPTSPGKIYVAVNASALPGAP